MSQLPLPFPPEPGPGHLTPIETAPLRPTPRVGIAAAVGEARLGPPPVVADGYGTVLADPPWRFANRTGKVAPEHKRLRRYATMALEEIAAVPVADLAAPRSHLYLWVPNALLREGLEILEAWGFRYVTNLVWYKVRMDGGPDGRGVGFYFRNVTEILLFGVRGRNARTLAAGRRQVNVMATRKREHSRKPDELYPIVEACSPGPRLELFARHRRQGWAAWGDEVMTGPAEGESA
jgi:N6-adenosine-specific RNA methylase IME4